MDAWSVACETGQEEIGSGRAVSRVAYRGRLSREDAELVTGAPTVQLASFGLALLLAIGGPGSLGGPLDDLVDEESKQGGDETGDEDLGRKAETRQQRSQ